MWGTTSLEISACYSSNSEPHLIHKYDIPPKMSNREHKNLIWEHQIRVEGNDQKQMIIASYNIFSHNPAEIMVEKKIDKH